jgi:lysophospholipase L1-like esterase
MKFFALKTCFIAVIVLQACLIACTNPKPSTPPFFDEIEDFKAQDKTHFPKDGFILFVGSSTFRKWTDLENVFKSYQAVNRGFGGATLVDMIYYEKDVIFPYKPRQIIIYCGDNDIATDTVNAELVLSRFKTLFNDIRTKMPSTPIAYVSIKPSPARFKYFPISKKSNRLIKDFLATQENAQFIDIFPQMLNSDGRPKPELFVEDSLHLNQNGYAIFEKAIKPHLIR